MSDNKLERDVLENSFTEDGKKKLKCKAALRIAGEHGIKPVRIGGVCNRNGIKIVACQLGCFK